MNIVSSQVDLDSGRITIDGRDVFADILVPAQMEDVARKQQSFTESLPEEDTKSGHVMPASFVTVSGSA